MTKGFYAPDLAAAHRTKLERLEKDKLRSANGDRAASAMGSVHSKGGAGGGDDVSGAGALPYFPLAPEQWKESVIALRQLSVMKYQKVLQCLFYLLKYQDREAICERGTNKLSWKKAKNLLTDDLLSKMAEYWPPGPKEEEYREY